MLLHDQLLSRRFGYEEIYCNPDRRGTQLLKQLTSKGKHRSQKILNALTLLACDEGEHQRKRSKNEEIARLLNTSMRKIVGLEP